MGEIVCYLPHKKSAVSQTVVTERIAPKICQGQPQTMCSQCFRFHLNPFTFASTPFCCPVKYFHDKLFEPIMIIDIDPIMIVNLD